MSKFEEKPRQPSTTQIVVGLALFGVLLVFVGLVLIPGFLSGTQESGVPYSDSAQHTSVLPEGGSEPPDRSAENAAVVAAASASRAESALEAASESAAAAAASAARDNSAGGRDRPGGGGEAPDQAYSYEEVGPEAAAPVVAPPRIEAVENETEAVEVTAEHTGRLTTSSQPDASIAASAPNVGWVSVVYDDESCGNDCAQVDVLERNHSYTLALNLLSDSYQERASERVNEAFRATPPGGALKLKLIPVFTNGATDAEDRTDLAQISFELVKQTPDSASGRSTIPFAVTSSARGCVQMVVSVWDAKMRLALDDLLVMIPLKGEQSQCRDPASPSTALTRPKVRSLAGGSDSYWASGPDDDSLRRISLHFFETGNRSFAIVSIREPDKPIEVAGWRLQSGLSDSFRSEEEFQKRVVDDRQQLDFVDIDQRWAYQSAAELLKDKLFTYDDDWKPMGALPGDVFGRISEMIKSDPAPVVSAQFFVNDRSPDARRMYLPLRLLAGPNSRMMSRDFHLVEPLRLASDTGNRCIAHWNVIVGASVDTGVPEAFAKIPKRIASLPERPWRSKALRTLDATRAFFRNDGAPATTQGLIVAAHHGKYGFEIEPKRGSIMPEDLKRGFGPGSSAFLAACGTASPESSSGMIRRLHQKNFESFVASPLSVQTGYALVLTEQLLAVLDKAYESGENATVKELYDRAIEETSRIYKLNNLNPGDAYQGLEYVQIGDPSTRICPFYTPLEAPNATATDPP